MWLLDSIVNVFTGQGLGKGKAGGNSYLFMATTPQELEQAYRGSWLPRKVVDIPAMDMCRQWRSWQAEDDQIEKIEAEEIRLNVQGKVLEAKIKARLYGGAAIVIGDGSSTPSEELLPDRIKAGGLQYLAVLTCQRLTAGELDMDIASPWFGTPRDFTIQSTRGAPVVVHPSRVVRFIGAPVPDVETAGSFTWGDSILEAVFKALKDAEAVNANVAEMTHETKVDVLRIPNLTAMAADPDYEARLTKRVSVSMMLKGLYNTLVMDSLEEYESKQLTFATLPEVMDRFIQVAAGAADIPVTRLLGQSPAGMNATGESDLRNYYDRIRSGQELELRPAMRTLDECLIMSALGQRDPAVHYRWSPLWQLGEVEKADIALKTSQAVTAYVNSGLFPDSAIAKGAANRIVEDGFLPGFEAALDEAEAEGDAIDFSEKASAAEEAAAAAMKAPQQPAQITRMQAAANDAAPRTLYVRRDVKNKVEIQIWAEAQGITDLVDDLHVTLIYSRTPVDWIKAGNANEYGSDGKDMIVIPEGGPRAVEPLGGMAAVLLFASSQLAWRHADIIRAGAEHGFPDYQPHVSLTKTPIDLDGIEPYRGKIVLGPEIFEDLRED